MLNASPATNTSVNEQLGTWHSVKVSQYRRNVLDLLNTFGKKALTCHIFSEIDLARLETLRKLLVSEGHDLTVTAFLIKAIGLAQQNHPVSRSLYLPLGRVCTCEKIVAGFTVEKEVKGEPIVYFGEIEDPQKKSLFEIGQELKDYAEQEVEKLPKLRQQHDFAKMPWLVRQAVLFLAVWFPAFRLRFMGATFGLSSLGALGVGAVAGPAVCTSVFGVGAVTECAVVRDGHLVVRPLVNLSLSFDQRAMDAGQAGRFLSEIKHLLEDDIGWWAENLVDQHLELGIDGRTKT